MRSFFLLALVLVLLAPALASAQDAHQAQIDTYSLKIDGRTVEVLFRVSDRTTHRDIQGLQPRDIKLLEDDKPIATQIELAETQADAANPTKTVDLQASANGAKPVDGSKGVDLSVVGATIGIVYDASRLLNDRTDYLAQGRDLILAFLEAGRPIAERNPESIGLFIPLSVPAVSNEQIQPEGMPGFSQDRNAVINSLNQLQPRAGKTNLFDTLSVAVGKTADAAAGRGTDAYLLVVTDGGDTASAGSYDALVTEAQARKVKLLIFGIGPQKRLAGNAAALTTLATKTGGAYVGAPEQGAVADFYHTHVTITGQSAYVLRYTTDLIDDGTTHHLVIQVAGAAVGTSDPIPLALQNQNQGGSFALGPVVQGYALRAGAIAVVLSLLMTGLVLFFQRFGGPRSRSLSGMTRH